MDYRERLKDLRIDNDLKQSDIARICNVSNRTVSHWETSRRQIPVDCIIKLCNHYKVSANYVLVLPDYPAPTAKSAPEERYRTSSAGIR